MQSNYYQFLSLIIIFGAFYFFLIRPQQKKQKERFKMLESLKKGDKVITIGGLHGVVVDLDLETVTLRVNEKTRLVFERAAINSIVTEQPEKETEKNQKVEEEKEKVKEKVEEKSKD